jgi:hypothetical protein
MATNNKRELPWLLCLLFLFFVGRACLAQVDRTGLNGSVRDAAGRGLGGARISALQTATGLSRETVRSSTGTYDIPELPIGLYRITSIRSAG